jgi:cysteine synthase A
MLCDCGTRYQSKLLNPSFLASKNLSIPDWLSADRVPLPIVLE